MKARYVKLLLVINLLVAASYTRGILAEEGRSVYRSPFSVALSPDGKKLYVSDRTAGCAVVIDTTSNKKLMEIPLNGQPTGLVLTSDGSKLYASEYGAGTVAVIETNRGKVTSRIKVGLRPVGLVLAPKSGRLFVCNTDTNDISIIDTAGKGKEIRRISLVREPTFAALTPDENTLIVGNALPLGSANDPSLAAVVSVVDVKTLKVVGSVKLPSGSTNVRGVCISPDGKWAYVVHGIGRFNLPTTQIARGWINTNGLTIIDIAKRQRYTTVLLDQLDEGAANPHDILCSKDGKRLWISLAGTHQITIIEVGKLLNMLAGKIPEQLTNKPYDSSTQNIWAAIGEDPKAKDDLVNDLTALYVADTIRRIPSGGNGPRGITLSADGQLYVANYFSGNVTKVDASNGKLLASIPVGPQPKVNAVRRGEMLFNDATVCFQHWQSCSSCHPDGRSDGLRWDLLNDGIGNPKKARSLVLSYKVSPVMSKGVRKDFKSAVQAGFKFILFVQVPQSDIDATVAYLKSLSPEPSPCLSPGGKLTPAAERGKKIFEGKANCVVCHSGPLHTDMKPYDVATVGEFDKPDDKFYTPKLVELYRTAPYLHDGRAVTLKEVLTTYNKNDRHGITSHLRPQEINDLVAYLLSL